MGGIKIKTNTKRGINMKKETKFIMGLAVLLLVAFSYIAVTKYTDYKQQEQLDIFQQGAQFGYEQAVTQLVQEAIKCNQVPITFNDQTINVVAVECLQQQ